MFSIVMLLFLSMEVIKHGMITGASTPLMLVLLLAALVPSSFSFLASSFVVSRSVSTVVPSDDRASQLEHAFCYR